MRVLGIIVLLILAGAILDSLIKQDQPLAETNAPLFVQMSTEITFQNPPVITGKTNLPDGTLLMVMLIGESPACIPECSRGYEQAVVQNGIFSTHSEGNSPLMSGSYTIDIVMPIASAQPEQVRASIGTDGQNLRGPLIEAVDPDTNQLVWVISSEKSGLSGFSVHYTNKIGIPESRSSNFGSSDLAAYESFMLPARRDAAVAFYAGICQIRDSFFFGIFSARYAQLVNHENAFHRLAASEWRKANRDSNLAWQRGFREAGMQSPGDLAGCQTLRDNPKFLDDLDRKFQILSADPQLSSQASITAAQGR